MDCLLNIHNFTHRYAHNMNAPGTPTFQHPSSQLPHCNDCNVCSVFGAVKEFARICLFAYQTHLLVCRQPTVEQPKQPMLLPLNQLLLQRQLQLQFGAQLGHGTAAISMINVCAIVRVCNCSQFMLLMLLPLLPLTIAHLGCQPAALASGWLIGHLACWLTS